MELSVSVTGRSAHSTLMLRYISVESSNPDVLPDQDGTEISVILAHVPS